MMYRTVDIVENINLGIYIYQLEDPDDDRSLRLLFANPATERLTGIPPETLLGRTLDENFPGLREKGIPRMFARVIRTQKAMEIDALAYEDSRISPGTFAVKAFPLQNMLLAVSIENITDKKLTEKELIQKNRELEKALESAREMHEQLLISEKMASLGQITAGVAHEIKNPLGYIQANIGPLSRDIADLLSVLDGYANTVQKKKLREHFSEIESRKEEMEFTGVVKEIQMLLEGIREGAARTTQIVKSLGDFSRSGQVELETGDVHRGIDTTLMLLSGEIGKRISIKKEYGDLPDIEYYPGQLNQVFMNILANACQAIDRKGEIVIRTHREQQRVLISIADSGKGMPEDVLKRIFEPFFTTKEMGRGAGLGLSLSYQIISRHQGSIEVHSEPGKGTEFLIKLPVKQSKNQ